MRTLRKVKLQGFKSITSAEIELRDLNVVIGANSSGKSNLIGVFRLLERVLSHNLQLYVASEPERRLHHGRKVTRAIDVALQYPSYKQTSDRPTVLAKIGIPTIRARFPYFVGWLARLEELGAPA